MISRALIFPVRGTRGSWAAENRGNGFVCSAAAVMQNVCLSQPKVKSRTKLRQPAKTLISTKLLHRSKRATRKLILSFLKRKYNLLRDATQPGLITSYILLSVDFSMILARRFLKARTAGAFIRSLATRRILATDSIDRQDFNVRLTTTCNIHNNTIQAGPGHL